VDQIEIIDLKAEAMDLTITAIGVNHKTASVEVRELFSCSPKGGKLEELPYLAHLEGVEEIVILSTCNRVEIYALLRDEGYAEKLLEEFLRLKLGNRNVEEFKQYFFVKKGREAVEHILSIPAGLSSMVIGENQIAAQFKEAFEIARRHKTLGPVLERLYQAAMRTAKRVRSETEIAKTPVSVSYIAVLLAKKVFGILEGIRVLLVGAGEMAELTARYLKGEKAQIFVTNRTHRRALELARSIGAGVVEWERFKEFLKETDIAIFSTAAEEYLLTAEEARRLFKRRTDPIVLIDISVPRNVDPKIKELEGVFLYDIDDLKGIAEKNLKTRLEEAKKGWPIVGEEAEKFLQWFENLKVNNLIKELNRLVERLKEGSLSENPAESLNIFSKRFLYAVYKSLKKHPEALEELVRNLREVVENIPPAKVSEASKGAEKGKVN